MAFPFPISSVQAVLGSVAAGFAVVAGTIKAAKPVWKRVPHPVKRVRDGLDALARIEKEFQPNGGGSLRDLVNQVQQKQAMSIVLLRRVASTVEHAVLYESTADGQALWISEYWEELSGVSPKESLGYGWAGAIHVEDRERVLQEFQSAFTQRRTFRCTFRVRHVTTDQITLVRTEAQPVHSLSGDAIIGWIGITTPAAS